jgi:hypothetical protein
VTPLRLFQRITPPGRALFSREGAKLFYPQITQINADWGVMSCRCASSHAAGFFADWGRFSQIGVCITAKARSFFIRRLRRLTQIGALSRPDSPDLPDQVAGSV